jgi:integrase
LKNLQYHHFQQREDGSRWIVLNRKKTGAASYIPLLDIPLNIIDKYRDTKFSGTDGYVFRMMTKENLNLQLKKIAKAAGIDRRLTYHVARHTAFYSVA